jgi:hypothetical protein
MQTDSTLSDPSRSAPHPEAACWMHTHFSSLHAPKSASSGVRLSAHSVWCLCLCTAACTWRIAAGDLSESARTQPHLATHSDGHHALLSTPVAQHTLGPHMHVATATGTSHGMHAAHPFADHKRDPSQTLTDRSCLGSVESSCDDQLYMLVCLQTCVWMRSTHILLCLEWYLTRTRMSNTWLPSTNAQ